MSFGRAMLACLVAAAALVAAQAPAFATTPACTGQSGAASAARQCGAGGSGTPSLQQRLGADVAQALTTQERLSQEIATASANELRLSAELAADEARVADLQNQVAQLNARIADLDARIAVERSQIASLARAIYQRQPTFLEIIASSGSVSEAVARTTDMLVAGERAQALEQRLQADLAKASADRDARQSDLDQENATLTQVKDGLAQLSGVQTELETLAAQAVTLIARIRAASGDANQVPADVTARLADLLETQELNLSAQEQDAAWAQANVGSGFAADQHLLPNGTGPVAGGVPLAWPMRGGVITQLFGPTSFVLEPPLGQYAHFHTGVDIAAPLGTPVTSAAAGVVIVVGHSAVGYGNYVIVAHGFGVLTLYGHLLETDVYQGQFVTLGQVVGKEGMTGWATGPHVHFEVRLNGQVVDPMGYLPPV